MRARADLVLVAGFVAVAGAVALGPVQAVDRTLRDLADAHRPQLAYDIAVNLNRLGAGGWLALIALIVAGGVAILRRDPRPLVPVAVAFILTGLSLTTLKWLFHRPPPHAAGLAEGAGLSFPSGHAVNTIVWYAVISFMIAPWLSTTATRCLRVAPPVIVGVVSVYLGFHWLTDVLAGVLLGLLIERAVARLRPAAPQPRPPGTRPRPSRSLSRR